MAIDNCLKILQERSHKGRGIMKKPVVEDEELPEPQTEKRGRGRPPKETVNK